MSRTLKRLNLHIRRDGTVAVSIPWSYTVGFADAFVTEQAQWIREAVSRQLRRNARNDQPLPSKAEALACFTAMSDKVYPAFQPVLHGQLGQDHRCKDEGAAKDLPGGIEASDWILLSCAVLFSFQIMAVDHFSPLVDGVRLSLLQFFAVPSEWTWRFRFFPFRRVTV